MTLRGKKSNDSIDLLRTKKCKLRKRIDRGTKDSAIFSLIGLGASVKEAYITVDYNEHSNPEE